MKTVIILGSILSITSCQIDDSISVYNASSKPLVETSDSVKLEDKVQIPIREGFISIKTNIRCDSSTIEFLNATFKYRNSDRRDLDIESCNCESIEHEILIVKKHDTISIELDDVLSDSDVGGENFFIESVSLIGEGKAFFYFELSSLFSGSIEALYDIDGELIWYKTINKVASKELKNLNDVLEGNQLNHTVPVEKGSIRREYLNEKDRYFRIIKT